MTTPNDLGEFLVDAAEWSSFAADMLQHYQRGTMTSRQRDAATGMMIKCTARKIQKEALSGSVNLEPVERMFDKARASGLSKLSYRARGLVISPANAKSRNAGALYVKRKSTSEYLGKVSQGVFYATSSADADTLPALAAIACDPAKEAKDYGRQTGECSVCGRQLTDATSIANAIGPVCAARWGF